RVEQCPRDCGEKRAANQDQSRTPNAESPPCMCHGSPNVSTVPRAITVTYCLPFTEYDIGVETMPVRMPSGGPKLPGYRNSCCPFLASNARKSPVPPVPWKMTSPAVTSIDPLVHPGNSE